MDLKQYQEAQKEALKGKFKGRKQITSIAAPLYPGSAEREYQRIANAYMMLLNQSVKEHLPEITRLYKQSLQKDCRYDDRMDILAKIKEEFKKITESLEKKISKYRLDTYIEKTALMAQKTSIREWKKSVKKTFGVDIFEDYYKGDMYSQLISKWISDNVSFVKSIPNDTLGEMERIVMSGFSSGMSIRDLTKEIQKEYGTSKSKAQSLARDQISTLNAQIAKQQQTDAGCSKYKWSSSKDSRVRDCHKAFDGRIFSWDNPPEGWYKTKQGIKSTGRKCHPGEDYCCRCVAIPVFDRENISVPVSYDDKRGKSQ